MAERDQGRWAGAAGLAAVVLFVLGALLVGDRPPLDAPAAAVAADLLEHPERVQGACVLFALAGTLLAVVLAAATAAGTHALLVARVCGLTFLALFLVDVTALAVASRPHPPDVVVALRDVELLAMGTAAPLVSAALAAFSVALAPGPLARLTALAAALYLLRLGTLLTTSGPFAADGVLGLVVPVVALLAWVVAASVALLRAR